MRQSFGANISLVPTFTIRPNGRNAAMIVHNVTKSGQGYCLFEGKRGYTSSKTLISDQRLEGGECNDVFTYTMYLSLSFMFCTLTPDYFS